MTGWPSGTTSTTVRPPNTTRLSCSGCSGRAAVPASTSAAAPGTTSTRSAPPAVPPSVWTGPATSCDWPAAASTAWYRPTRPRCPSPRNRPRRRSPTRSRCGRSDPQSRRQLRGVGDRPVADETPAEVRRRLAADQRTVRQQRYPVLVRPSGDHHGTGRGEPPGDLRQLSATRDGDLVRTGQLGLADRARVPGESRVPSRDGPHGRQRRLGRLAVP